MTKLLITRFHSECDLVEWKERSPSNVCCGKSLRISHDIPAKTRLFFSVSSYDAKESVELSI